MEWISVKDRLPEDLKSVIAAVRYKNGKIIVFPEVMFDGLKWAQPSGNEWSEIYGEITH